MASVPRSNTQCGGALGRAQVVLSLAVPAVANVPVVLGTHSVARRRLLRMSRTQPQAGKATMRSTERGRWFGDGGSRVVSKQHWRPPSNSLAALWGRGSRCHRTTSHGAGHRSTGRRAVCTHVAAHAVIHVVGVEGAQQIQLLPSEKFEHRSAQAHARTRKHTQAHANRQPTHAHTAAPADDKVRRVSGMPCSAAPTAKQCPTHVHVPSVRPSAARPRAADAVWGCQATLAPPHRCCLEPK